MNSRRVALLSAPRPGRSTMRLPVCVGSGMRVLASSKRIARGGTPASFSAGDQLLADFRFLAGDALDGEEAHKPLHGGIPVDGKHGRGAPMWC